MLRLRRALLLLSFACFATMGLAGPRDAQWAKVDDAVRHGLPKTALQELQPIITAALADHAYPEAIRAIARKVALEAQTQPTKPDDKFRGNELENKIRRFQVELAKAPAPMKPVMEAILAHWYWDYFQQNRWRFLQRTQTAVSPGTDFATWDLARILTEIDRHFSAALADPATLKATPIQTYDDLLVKGTVPDAYRPTLFDFLTYDALAFYQAGEQAAISAEDSFELEATSPIFANVPQFLAWKLPASDTYSPQLKAIRLYQELLRFHEHDADRSAFLDADLHRLEYGAAAAVGDEKSARYQTALRGLIDANPTHEVSSRALANLAQQLNAEGDAREAHAVAERGYRTFPKTAGGTVCRNLIQQIEAPSARVETEHVWNAPWPTLNVTYRNVPRIYFRAIPMDFDTYVAKTRWAFSGVSNREQELDELRAATPALAWDAELPPTADFKEHTEELPAPATLKPGFYFIVASADRSISAENNQVSVATVWVSDLALVTQRRRYGGSSGFVLKAGSGEPVAGATVRRWQQDRNGYYQPLPPLTTGTDGRFELPEHDRGMILLAESGGQAVANANLFYSVERTKPATTQERTVFFTDRAIYRPGQTIQYKGICVRGDQRTGEYAAIADEPVEVTFRDANGKEITRARQRTNGFGSFSGVFTAPRDRLTGAMSIAVTEGPDGSANFSVEEYKRPKFEVKLEPPAEAAKLGALVVVTGRARAYTGAPIDGANVRWRVERRTVLPFWCWWFRPPQTKAIAHGSVVTQSDGTFRLEFPATPDAGIPAATEPTFEFAVHADVTDTTGETRSDDREVRAGYTALKASVAADEWQTATKPVVFTVTTQSLDGDPQPVSGTLTVHALTQPAAVVRRGLQPAPYFWQPIATEPKPDPANPDSWELGQQVSQFPFTTDASGRTEVNAPLPVGIYRVSLTTKDRFGHTVTARQTVQVIDPKAQHYPIRVANHFAAASWSVEPGQTFTALWGTGYPTGRAYVELLCDGGTLRSYWSTPGRTQEPITLPITDAMRGGVTVRVTYVRENRMYFNQHVVQVPWSNKQLSVKWEHFRSKLTPGQKETWTAIVTGPDAKRAAAEMVATLYDASLDQFRAHRWPQQFNLFRSEYSPGGGTAFANTAADFTPLQNWKWRRDRPVNWRYREFPADLISSRPNDVGVIVLSPFSVAAPASGRGYMAESTLAGSRANRFALRNFEAVEAVMPPQSPEPAATLMGPAASADTTPLFKGMSAPLPRPDLNAVVARRNLQETAFFYPHLLTDKDGVVRIEFTIPEALTRWRFLGFAHDADLRSGFLTDTTVTAKDLMVQPNPPRFLREGDTVEFTVKVTNQSSAAQRGTVRLTFADAASLNSADAALGIRAPEQPFDVPAGQSRSYSWRISVPDGQGFLTYKAVAASPTLSDGEEGNLPVLSRRVLVTESLPLPIRGPATKRFEFTKLLDSGKSDSLRQVALTAEMTSQPAWYAVMALPYLMEFPYECSEQVFNRLYANTLARHIATSDPKIRRIFDLWKDTPALESPLEKNQDLKSVMLEETPWVRQAESETQARHNVGLLFDSNRLDTETAAALQKLTDQQLGDGHWPWFPGGPPSDYITLYVVTGFGRLRHLGVDTGEATPSSRRLIDVQPAVKALSAVDAWIDERYRQVQRLDHPDTYVPGAMEAMYLYGRSFFLDDQPIAAAQRPAVDFFLRQAREHWVKVGDRQSQAHLALALQRFGDTATPQAIVRSLKERSVDDPEMGMYWRDTEQHWWWYRAPIETQALMIEAFSEIGHDAQAVDDCKTWLLKQKQTQDWRTTKATADAVYALLLGGGESLLASDARVQLSLGGVEVKPTAAEAGTGYYEQKFTGPEIKPSMGNITVTKADSGVSWGSVHWQYLEDMAKVTPHEATPLAVKKTLFVRETTARGPVLEPVTGPLAVGDELVVRIELRTDRDMEFVHLKDQRGSGTEPVDVLSRYRFQDGLAYYETTRDTATHFFIDYLPKGTYVFEYATRVQLKGHYQTGIAEAQCMYAPEFNSHSGSVLLEVR